MFGQTSRRFPSLLHGALPLLGPTALLAMAGCDDPAALPLEVVPPAQSVIIQDRAERVHLSIPDLLAALGNRSRTDGTLIIGLKEPSAVRGVSVDGKELPTEARVAAENALRVAFPSLRVQRGVLRTVQVQTALGTRTDTIWRTSITVQGPFDAGTLSALRASPVVDYLAPNFVDGESFAEHIPWGVQSSRAPEVWNQGYAGAGIGVGMVDTGWDMNDGNYNIHPDFQDYAISFVNLVAQHPDNGCPNSFTQPCYYEDPLHGTGVFGVLTARRNGTGAIGASIGSSPQANVAKPFYLTSFGANRLPVDDFADGVRSVADMHQVEWGLLQPIAVTSIGYLDTAQANYPSLQDAFRYAYARGVLFFAAAGNNTPGQAVIVPARFSEVVAVGALENVSGTLRRANFSPIDPKIELVAGGVSMRISWNRRGDDWGPFGVYAYTRVESGTSFAAPLAAGVARLGLARYSYWSISELRTRLRQAAKDLGPAGFDNEYGYGMVDAVCIIELRIPCF
jgi:subtilisin family serine protease